MRNAAVFMETAAFFRAGRDSLYYGVDSVEPESSECPPDIRILFFESLRRHKLRYLIQCNASLRCVAFVIRLMRLHTDRIDPSQHIAGIVGFTVGLIPNEGVVHGAALCVLELQRQSHSNT